MNSAIRCFATLSFLVACTACASTSAAGTEGGDGKSIAQVCKEQEAAWNRGDLEAFMAIGYERSEALTFFSGGSVTHGFDATLARYVKRYRTGQAEMGKLAFTNLEILPVSDDAALVRGRWDLDFEKLPDVGGLTTLLFKRTPAGWRIVHDHSSADDK